MTRDLAFLALSLSLFSILGCGRIKVAEAPGGRMHITCAKGMKDCVTRAGKICGDKGYQIFSGESRVSLLGGSSSPYRKPSESAELEVQCGVEMQPEEPDIVFKLPKRSDEPSSESSAESGVASSPSPSRMCVPGATQKCVGRGACDGGQVCLPDGSGFGTCDCGDQATPPTAPTRKAPPVDADDGISAPQDQAPKTKPPAAPGAAPEPVPLRE